MRRLLVFMKQMVCDHEFIDEEKQRYETIETSVFVSRTCKKCGYHYSYKKFKTE